MKPVITPDHSFIAKLEGLPLFEHCGEITHLKLPFNYRQVFDKPLVNQELTSPNRSDFTLEARNRLTLYLHHNKREDYQPWNSIALAYKPFVLQLTPKSVQFAAANGIDPVLAHATDWNLLAMCMENHYQKTAPRIPVFFLNLLPIYEAGHTPCGWDGEVEEDLKGRPMDMSQGTLLIY